MLYVCVLLTLRVDGLEHAAPGALVLRRRGDSNAENLSGVEREVNVAKHLSAKEANVRVTALDDVVSDVRVREEADSADEDAGHVPLDVGRKGDLVVGADGVAATAVVAARRDVEEVDADVAELGGEDGGLLNAPACV